MLLTYFCVTGIWAIITSLIKLKDNNSFKDFKEHNTTGVDSEILILIFCGLIGWFLLPLAITRDVYYFFTKKDLLETLGLK